MRCVNSLLGENYGSNCVDCRQPLCDRAHCLVHLHWQTNAASASIDNPRSSIHNFRLKGY